MRHKYAAKADGRKASAAPASASSGGTSKSKSKKKKGGIDKSMIGAPSSFQHVAHMGFDAEKGFSSNNVDPSWERLLTQLESQGISRVSERIICTFAVSNLTASPGQTQIVKNEAFIRNFVEGSGGPPPANAPPLPPPSAGAGKRVPPPAPPSRAPGGASQHQIKRKPPAPPPPAPRRAAGGMASLQEQQPSAAPVAPPPPPPPTRGAVPPPPPPPPTRGAREWQCYRSLCSRLIIAFWTAPAAPPPPPPPPARGAAGQCRKAFRACTHLIDLLHHSSTASSAPTAAPRARSR